MIHAICRGPLATLNNTKNVLAKAFANSLPQNGTKIVRVGPVHLQVATLTATHGEKYPYAEPWPYETKPFVMRHELFDYTSARMCENSKVITVDGNIGVGKLDFAKRLAKEFDLAVMPSTPEGNVFNLEESNLDCRMFNELLPDFAKIYDLKAFMEDPHPESGVPGRLQVQWYEERWHDYRQALVHLLSTGQGVVLVRSHYSDCAYAEALRSMGWMTKPGLDYYYELYNNTAYELLRPHISIYLDASVDVCKERIAKKKDPLYANARNLTDDYLHAIEDAFKTKYLPSLRPYAEVLEIDWTEVADDMDMDAIAEEIATIKLEAEDNEDKKFHEWYNKTEEQLSAYRRLYTDPNSLTEFWQLPLPFQAPELMMTAEQYKAFDDMVLKHPAVRYAKDWSPELGKKGLFSF